MRTCLIVDDSRVIRKAARLLLQGLDFAVEEAEDGSIALAAIHAHLPDVVLLDLNMPVMTGLEFLHALGAAGLPRRPKVVFCTTESDRELVRSAIAAGADEYVLKPYSRETLRDTLALVGIAPGSSLSSLSSEVR